MRLKPGAITFEAHEVRIDFTPKYVNWDSPRVEGRNRKILMQAQHSLEIMGREDLVPDQPGGVV